MGGRFRAWVPNATGNLSFSLIGIEGQPTPCEARHELTATNRKIIAVQRRNLSDNLLTKSRPLPGLPIHELDFVLLAQTARYRTDSFGVLRGWILIFEHLPTDIAFLGDEEGTDLRAIKSALSTQALFMVSFRLYRTGRVEFRVPDKLGIRDVRYGDNQVLTDDESSRPLVAQCFYFLRDITHRHQHHNSASDTLTTVWPSGDPSLWIRETLYELYRRILMLRRQHYVGGQEKALGILAYITAFETAIAGPYRKEAEKRGEPSHVPTYEEKALKDSLNVNIENKRRVRIQRNVMAAAFPAFTAAMLSLANAIYRPPAEYVAPVDLWAYVTSFASHPMTTAIHWLSTTEWAFPTLVVFGYFWVAYFTGVLQPTDARWVKGITQAAAVWGRLKAAGFLFVVGMGVTAAIILLFRL